MMMLKESINAVSGDLNGRLGHWRKISLAIESEDGWLVVGGAGSLKCETMCNDV